MINIGTSGWNYKHWVDNFYPKDLKQKEFLRYYSEHFQTVEVNNTFYKLPEKDTIIHWIETVPEDFVFSIKASRYITHMKKLKDPEESIIKFFDRIEHFENKLGPILFQLPPHFNFDIVRLESFINVLPKNHRYTFEFRDESWFNNETYSLLRANNIAFCMYYLGDFKSPGQVTSDFIYIRLHGPNGLGAGEYSEEKLQEFAKNIKGKEVFSYFNNDEAGYAVKNALKFRELVYLQS